MSDLAQRFGYHKPSNGVVVEKHELVRDKLLGVALDLQSILPLDTGRENALVITKLEEAMFWANASIARSATNA